jgi:hypothetical protein
MIDVASLSADIEALFARGADAPREAVRTAFADVRRLHTDGLVRAA